MIDYADIVFCNHDEIGDVYITWNGDATFNVYVGEKKADGATFNGYVGEGKTNVAAFTHYNVKDRDEAAAIAQEWFESNEDDEDE